LSKLLVDDAEDELVDLDLSNLMNEPISDDDDEYDEDEDGKSEDETTIGNQKSLGVGSTKISLSGTEDDDNSEDDADELEEDFSCAHSNKATEDRANEATESRGASRGRGRGAGRGRGRGFTKETLLVVDSLLNPVIKSPQVKRLRSGKVLFKKQ
jgi:hypothetical protein